MHDRTPQQRDACAGATGREGVVPSLPHAASVAHGVAFYVDIRAIS